MRTSLFFGLISFVGHVTCGHLLAQTSEDHGVIRLTSEVGPYRPQDRPDLGKVERLILEQTNQFRTSQNLELVESNEILKTTAAEFAAFMARKDLYGHRADGQSPAERAREHDYELCMIAENIAYFFATEGFMTEELAKQAVDGWINSPPHRENMLKPSVTQIGIGVAQSEATGVFYAVQLFGRPRSQAITFEIKNGSGQSIRYSVGEQAYSLPPRYKRTHQMCVPSTLELRSLDEEEKQVLASRTPQSGDKYLVTQTEGKLQLQDGGVD